MLSCCQRAERVASKLNSKLCVWGNKIMIRLHERGLMDLMTHVGRDMQVSDRWLQNRASLSCL